MIRAVEKFDWPIRLPVHVMELIKKRAAVSRQLVQRLGREPTLEDVSRAIGLPPARLREIARIDQEPLSLEMPIGDGDDTRLGELIEEQNPHVPEDAAFPAQLQAQLDREMDVLTPREREVLRRRFGLNDGHPRTFEQVGRELGVTRERIRQIEAVALRKLRHAAGPHRRFADN